MKRSEHIIDRILYTEKGTQLQEKENKFLFRVASNARKADIKRAVEELFGVHVEKVNTMNRKGKRKRSRTIGYGRTSAWKRAVVTLREGENIDLLE